MHKYQVFFWFLACFIAGVAIGSFFSLSRSVTYIVALIGLIGVALAWRGLPLSWHKRWPYIMASFGLIFLAVGLWRIETALNQQSKLSQFVEAAENLESSSENQIDYDVFLLGVVDRLPELGKGQRLVIKAKSVQPAENALPVLLNERVLVYTELSPKYKFGDKLKLHGTVRRPENYHGSFDYEAYLAKDGIFSLMYYPDIEPASFEIGFWQQLKLSIFSRIFRLRSHFETAVMRAMPEPHASLVNGVLTGARAGLPDVIRNDFSKTGVTHILAISGYNITIVASVFMALLVWFVRRQKAFWFAVGGIIIFTILTGAEASVVRAAIMGLIVLLARNSGRQNYPLNALIVAAFLMILFNPMVLRFDAGFQLSFAATIGLLYISPIIERRFVMLTNTLGIKEIIIMTFSAQLAVLPLILYYFGYISIVSLPANMLILPFVPTLMLVGFLAGLLTMVIPALGQVIGYLAWLISSYILSIARFGANLEFLGFDVRISALLLFIMYGLLAVGVYVFKVHSQKK